MKKNKRKNKIAICHYRVGGTDGVSLEIEKRKEILEKHGCEVKLIAGPRSKGADFIIKELEWDNGIVPIIKENGFLHFNRKDLNDQEFRKKIVHIADKIKSELYKIQKQENFDTVLIHNIFSFGGHIAAARAFTHWINKYKIFTIATHHDFYWERKEFNLPRNGYLRQYMETYMPPKSKYIEHVVINSLAQKEMKKRRNLDAHILPDIFDFNQPTWQKDSFNKDFLKQFDVHSSDLILLQATRVIPRKGIEIAIDFAKELQKNIEKFRGQTLYNGKYISRRANVALIIAGYAEDEKRDYLFKLKSKAFDTRVRAKFISDYVKAKRKFNQGVKTYSLWDAYVHADLVTFPSIWEGWGNQFIEAVFARKPIALLKYPVYKKDIEKEGYQTISFGTEIKKDEDGLFMIPDKKIKQAVQQSIRWLKKTDLDKRLDKNWKIGKKYHDYEVLEKFIVEKLNLT